MKQYLEKLIRNSHSNSSLDFETRKAYEQGVKDLFFELTATRPWLENEQNEDIIHRLEREKERIRQSECTHESIRVASNPTYSDVCNICGKEF
jgi:hypothetical protein